MLTIDADAHVLETEQTWESMDGAEHKYRPRIVEATGGESKDEYWLVDGTLRLKSGNVGRNTPQASREMRDRLERLVAEGFSRLWVGTFHGTFTRDNRRITTGCPSA